MPRPKNSKNKIRPLRPFNPSGDFNAQEAREQNMIGKRLADARKRAHLTQPDVVNRLSLGLGSLNQAVSIRRSNSAVIGFAEEPILPANHKRADRVFGGIIGDGNATIIQKTHELCFLVSGIGYVLVFGFSLRHRSVPWEI